MAIGIDVRRKTHYAGIFDYRDIEFSKKPFKFDNSEAGTGKVTSCKVIKRTCDNNSQQRMTIGIESYCSTNKAGRDLG